MFMSCQNIAIVITNDYWGMLVLGVCINCVNIVILLDPKHRPNNLKKIS